MCSSSHIIQTWSNDWSSKGRASASPSTSVASTPERSRWPRAERQLPRLDVDPVQADAGVLLAEHGDAAPTPDPLPAAASPARGSPVTDQPVAPVLRLLDQPLRSRVRSRGRTWPCGRDMENMRRAWGVQQIGNEPPRRRATVPDGGHRPPGGVLRARVRHREMLDMTEEGVGITGRDERRSSSVSAPRRPDASRGARHDVRPWPSRPLRARSPIRGGVSRTPSAFKRRRAPRTVTFAT